LQLTSLADAKIGLQMTHFAGKRILPETINFTSSTYQTQDKSPNDILIDFLSQFCQKI
jgi:hypothetical protein